jgi:hypothetical protein
VGENAKIDDGPEYVRGAGNGVGLAAEVLELYDKFSRICSVEMDWSKEALLCKVVVRHIV